MRWYLSETLSELLGQVVYITNEEQVFYSFEK